MSLINSHSPMSRLVLVNVLLFPLIVPPPTPINYLSMQHYQSTACARSTIRALKNLLPLRIAELNECVLYNLWVDADDIENDIPGAIASAVHRNLLLNVISFGLTIIKGRYNNWDCKLIKYCKNYIVWVRRK